MTTAKSVGRRGHWWPWLVGAAAVLVVVVVTVTLAVRSLRHDNHRAAAPIGTPTYLLVSFPLDRQPVPGWRQSASAIGLPPEVGVGRVFATNGTKAYFATSCSFTCPDHPTTWIYGLDLGTGARLFAPAKLTGAQQYEPACYQNGATVAVCVTATDPTVGDHLVISVLDLDRGTVTFTGPTDFNSSGALHGASSLPSGSHAQLNRIGNFRGESRLVASVANKGVYGVGPHGKLTWFIPGSGRVLFPNDLQVSDIPPLSLAVSDPTDSDPVFRVFSVIDGTDLTPTAPSGTVLKRATVYTGGFAYQYEEGNTSAGVLFYDTTGRLVKRQRANHYPVLLDNAAMPIVLDAGTFRVYTATGSPLASIPADSAYTYSPQFRAVGTKLFTWLSYSNGEHWQQWDLGTGKLVNTCKINLSGYMGSDGHIVLIDNDAGMMLASDMSTCQTVWQIPIRDYTIEQVGSALIRETRDEVMALQRAS
jgi:hypothetical protein